MKKVLIAILLCSTALIANAQKNTDIGQSFTEIELKNPEGKYIKLSSIEGKVVLIDFWASWCGPCRAENPNLIKTYDTFKKAKFKKGTGFEIYSVSLDQNEANWKKAIAADKLIWAYHVSDLMGWKSTAAQKYGINSIPMNFLLDVDGKIVAKNLRGDDLDNALIKLLKDKNDKVEKKDKDDEKEIVKDNDDKDDLKDGDKDDDDKKKDKKNKKAKKSKKAKK